ncbi:MAG: alpha/beta hydrolase [Planctomycetota bacterium]|nr:alpha/beta hydrolase [Planctomycetota bacterium]
MTYSPLSEAARGATHESEAESAGFLNVGGEQLYYVLHAAGGAAPERAPRVLLVGPFASDRSHMYIGWVRWARYLASSGFEVMRFDGRGTGESSGQQAEVSFSTWLEDVEACVKWLDARGTRPLTIHGMGGAALMAAKAFRRGLGDSLLLWAPPDSGRDLLMGLLRRRLASDMALGASKPGGRDAYIALLESGKSIEVDGFEWSPALWRESAEYTLMLPDAAESGRPRPHKTVAADVGVSRLYAGERQGAPQRGKAVAKRHPLNPDMSDFFAGNVAWIRESLAMACERERRL